MTPERLAELRRHMTEGERLDCSAVFWQKLCEEMLEELARLRRIEEAARELLNGIRRFELYDDGYRCVVNNVYDEDIAKLREALEAK